MDVAYPVFGPRILPWWQWKTKKYFGSQSGVSQLRWPPTDQAFLLYKRAPSLQAGAVATSGRRRPFANSKRAAEPPPGVPPSPIRKGRLRRPILGSSPPPPRIAVRASRSTRSQKKNLIGRKFPGRSWALFTPCLRSIRFGGDGDGGKWKWKWNRYCDNTSLVQIEGGERKEEVAWTAAREGRTCSRPTVYPGAR
ncbi:unnamed protein product [Musa hybrid cultivar]